ncbi:UDP-N-acetyl-alpha-D-glucosamine C6 dehydratase [subsurface metagenome]
MEQNPEEAVKNNIIGTKNLAELAGEYNAERFVLISTDKAVNPVCIMGATKKIAELIVYTTNNKYPETNFITVRFGNVLGSRGSVVGVSP